MMVSPIRSAQVNSGMATTLQGPSWREASENSLRGSTQPKGSQLSSSWGWIWQTRPSRKSWKLKMTSWDSSATCNIMMPLQAPLRRRLSTASWRRPKLERPRSTHRTPSTWSRSSIWLMESTSPAWTMILGSLKPSTTCPLTHPTLTRPSWWFRTHPNNRDLSWSTSSCHTTTSPSTNWGTALSTMCQPTTSTCQGHGWTATRQWSDQWCSSESTSRTQMSSPKSSSSPTSESSEERTNSLITASYLRSSPGTSTYQRSHNIIHSIFTTSNQTSGRWNQRAIKSRLARRLWSSLESSKAEESWPRS